MALKKSDLYSSLWAGADELRGGMDASQYKDYVLTLLFVKYVSDKAKADPNSLVEVPEGGSFDDVVKLKGKPDIGEKINIAIRTLADANDLQGVINNADFDDTDKLGKGKELVDRLTKLVGIFQDLDFSGSHAEGDDLLGDAYEYLMRHFATESGKSKGQFYTPAEVSRIMASLIGITKNTPRSATVYDPTCGSGSLLLKVADSAPNGLTVYGQEKDNATRALAVMNMILHGNATADIRQGDTLTSPQFTIGNELRTFDFLVANPPFSVKSWTNGLENEFGRFDAFGRPPEKNGDYAFLLHMIKSLKSTGRGAVILPHGVLFRGNAEAIIRKELIKRGYIKGIIGLPANLFYGTGIPACIIVLDKHDAQARTGIFMIDASKGFAKDGPKNRLRPRDVHQIVDAFTKQLEVDRYSRMVPVSEIASPKNDYNLNIPRYIDSSEPEDIQDLHAHLKGGIPNCDLDALQPYWDAFPSLRPQLFKPLHVGYSELAVDRADIPKIVTDSAEYRQLATSIERIVKIWWNNHVDELTAVSPSTRPADLAKEIGDSLLAAFRNRPLVDEYGVYEQFMSYWNDVMHDDVALVMSEGWDAAAKPRPTIESKERKLNETPDLVIGAGRGASKYKMDLLPPALIVARYFATEQAEVDELNALAEQADQAVEEFIEENSGEEALLADAMDDGKLSKALAAARLKIARYEDPRGDEFAALTELIGLYNAETHAKTTAKEGQAELDRKTLAKYAELATADIQRLVLDDKWGARFVRGARAELDVLIRRLVDRLNVLGDRYAEPLGVLDPAIAPHAPMKDALVEKLVIPAIREAGQVYGNDSRPHAERTGQEAWSTALISDIVARGSDSIKIGPFGSALKKSFLTDHGFKVYGQENVFEKNMALGERYIDESRFRLLRSCEIMPGDFLISMMGTVGQTMVVPIGIQPGIMDSHLLRLRLDDSLVHAEYLQQLFGSRVVIDQIKKLSVGGIMEGLSSSIIKRISIPLPPIQEQKLIAELLAEQDRERASLMSRAHKVGDIKQGMMQELLTGRTRLVGEGAA